MHASIDDVEGWYRQYKQGIASQVSNVPVQRDIICLSTSLFTEPKVRQNVQ
jgi:hypothetical protein